MLRRSTDKGASWGAAKAIGPTTGPWSFEPILFLAGSKGRLVYEREGDANGTTSAVFYRESSDGGSTWSSAVKVSNTVRHYSIPAGVGAAGPTIVAWSDWQPDMLDSDVFVRRGS
jgi:hypothetical protein